MTTKLLTAAEAAEILGISSETTVKNWLEGGSFPGVVWTESGEWRAPLEEVLKVKKWMCDLVEKNQAGDMTPPDCDDEPWPVI